MVMAEVRRKSIGHSGIEDCKGRRFRKHKNQQRSTSRQPTVEKCASCLPSIESTSNTHKRHTSFLFFGGETKGGYSKQTQKLKGVERGDRDRRQLEIVDQLLCVCIHVSLSVCVFGRPET
jgi:hypothetical protein